MCIYIYVIMDLCIYIYVYVHTYTYMHMYVVSTYKESTAKIVQVNILGMRVCSYTYTHTYTSASNRTHHSSFSLVLTSTDSESRLDESIIHALMYRSMHSLRMPQASGEDTALTGTIYTIEQQLSRSFPH